jgi:hypothetical protein
MSERGDAMSETKDRSRMPRFNHVAMSVPAETLDESGRTDILRFYDEVFGWTEMPTLTEDRVRLVLRAHSNEQFVFLVADPKPMACPTTDHFGMSVATPEELSAIRERAQKFRERDSRVEIVDGEIEDYKVLKLHNFYVRYLLPMSVEVQCYEWAEGVDANSLPES